MQEGFVPFIPPQSDLKKVIRTQSGGNCYVFDTACKKISHEETIKRERALLEAYERHRDKLAIRATIQKENGKDSF